MAVINIPWTTGSGNITLTYTGEGNDTVIVSSTENELTVSRSQTLTFRTSAGSPQSTATIIVSQAAGKGEILITVGGEPITLRDNDTIAVL